MRLFARENPFSRFLKKSNRALLTNIWVPCRYHLLKVVFAYFEGLKPMPLFIVTIHKTYRRQQLNLKFFTPSTRLPSGYAVGLGPPAKTFC